MTAITDLAWPETIGPRYITQSKRAHPEQVVSEEADVSTGFLFSLGPNLQGNNVAFSK